MPPLLAAGSARGLALGLGVSLGGLALGLASGSACRGSCWLPCLRKRWIGFHVTVKVQFGFRDNNPSSNPRQLLADVPTRKMNTF